MPKVNPTVAEIPQTTFGRKPTIERPLLTAAIEAAAGFPPNTPVFFWSEENCSGIDSNRMLSQVREGAKRAGLKICSRLLGAERRFYVTKVQA